MQKYVLCILAIVSIAFAAPQQDHSQVEIVKQDSIVSPDGYKFDFETSDGTARQEQGTLKEISEDHKALEVTGSYKYVAPDGLEYSVTFIANEHGYQPLEHVQHPGQGQ